MEKTKTFTLFQLRTLYNWFNDFRQERIKSLPIKTQWNLLQIIKLFEQKIQDYEVFENELIGDIQKEYTTEEKAIKKEDNDRVIWQIKDEFLEEYRKKISKIQDDELTPLLNEKYTYTFNSIDVNEILENLQNDTKIILNDLEMLDFINK